MRFCEICKQEIESDRAENFPSTRLCSKHAKEAQKFGGEFIAMGTQGSLSKTGSFKKNPGDVGVEQHRNVKGLAALREQYERETIS